jgi:NitT/TauT family transport system substrate-binding protein
MYASPEAHAMYAKKVNVPVDMVKEAVDQFYPKAVLQTDDMKDIEGAVRDAVTMKFLDKPLTKEQLAEFVQTPPRK